MINFERLIYMRQPFLRKVLTGILMRELSQRTSQFTDSVIRRMTRVANKYGAVNLSQGFPDFDPPVAITDRLAEVAGEGPHQYALTWGAKNFRDALAAKQEHFSGMKIDAESEIVVTCGSTEAMMAAMMSVVNPGGIIELVYIVLQSVVKPGITGFFKIDLHIKCYIYLS
mgnify:CR=1 FL=1